MSDKHKKSRNSIDVPIRQINVYSDNSVFVISGRQVSPFKSWGIYSDMSLIEIAKLGLNSNSMSIFMYMVGCMDYENEIIFNQTQCAKELNMTRESVNRSIKILIESDLIRKVTKSGTLSVYLVNPYLFYKGKAKSWGQVQDRYAAADG